MELTLVTMIVEKSTLFKTTLNRVSTIIYLLSVHARDVSEVFVWSIYTAQVKIDANKAAFTFEYSCAWRVLFFNKAFDLCCILDYNIKANF